MSLQRGDNRIEDFIYVSKDLSLHLFRIGFRTDLTHLKKVNPFLTWGWGFINKSYDFSGDRNLDIIVNVDADNQYNADDIPKLIEPIISGKAEIVVGARQIADIEHFSLTKKILQRIGSQVVEYPFKVGHECSARVLAVGENVTRLTRDGSCPLSQG